MDYRLNCMRTSLTTATILVGVLVVAAQSTSAAPTPVDFTTKHTESVLGAGTVPGASILDIQNYGSGNGIGLKEGEDPATYGAPNGSSGKNGGLGELGGFADTANKNHLFTFVFSEPVSFFQLRVLDFGDYNPYGATDHTFGISASNDGTEIDSQSVTFSSDGSVNPRNPTDLYLDGDAVNAKDGDPGNVLFKFDESAMTSFQLFYDSDLGLVGPTDPNIAFSDLAFTPTGGSTEIPLPGSLGLLAFGLFVIGYRLRLSR